MVTGPGLPSPTVHSPDGPFTRPTGVITAAVPHANTSVSSPDSQPARHSVTEMAASSAGMPRSGPSFSSVSLVTPGSRVPVRAGVTSRACGPDPYTKNRFIPPISSTRRCSRASSQTT